MLSAVRRCTFIRGKVLLFCDCAEGRVNVSEESATGIINAARGEGLIAQACLSNKSVTL